MSAMVLDGTWELSAADRLIVEAKRWGSRLRFAVMLLFYRARVWRDKLDERRIASPEMLSWADLLPHVTCSPPVFAGGGGYEADQHDDT